MNIDIVIPVYNANHTVTTLLDSIDKQIKAWEQLTVIAVNDGSSDNSLDTLKAFKPSNYTLIIEPLKQNAGRANALNKGIALGSGDAVLIIDSDCHFKNNTALKEFTYAYQQGHQLIFGSLEDTGYNFWAQYFNQSQAQKSITKPLSFSSTNMFCSRALLEKSGGFNLAYKHYGFEDRDLIARLIQLEPSIAFRPKATLAHQIDETLKSYSTKLYLSGHYSAQVFKNNFPELYQQTTYSWVDYSTTPFPIRLLLTGLKLIKRPITYITQKTIDYPRVPIKIKIIFTQLIASISYFEGTQKAASSN